MKFIKQRLTVEDVKSLTKGQIENLHERTYWGDPEPGEAFYDFRTDEVHVIKEVLEENSNFYLVYDGGKTNDWDSCFPLLSVGQLMDLLSLETYFEVRSFEGGWLAIYEDQVLRTDDRNGLIDLLFDCLKIKLS